MKVKITIEELKDEILNLQKNIIEKVELETIYMKNRINPLRHFLNDLYEKKVNEMMKTAPPPQERAESQVHYRKFMAIEIEFEIKDEWIFTVEEIDNLKEKYGNKCLFNTFTSVTKILF
jgi:hypothetical protein